MSKIVIPEGYKTPLSVYEMQRAIEFIKSNFQVNLGQALNLRRVSAPLFVDENSGLNDNLNGVERPVSFDIPDVGSNAQVVHSLAKWKRLALKIIQELVLLQDTTMDSVLHLPSTCLLRYQISRQSYLLINLDVYKRQREHYDTIYCQRRRRNFTSWSRD